MRSIVTTVPCIATCTLVFTKYEIAAFYSLREKGVLSFKKFNSSALEREQLTGWERDKHSDCSSKRIDSTGTR